MKFGRWTVLRTERRRDPKTGRSRRYCQCLCDCGVKRSVALYSLTSDHSKSCGCLREIHLEKYHRRNRKHGLSTTPEYFIWHAMIRRCSDPTNVSWKNYGGRGIKVCVRWRKSFRAFFKDMGPRPSSELSIDRWDNNGNYQPSNCHWVTRSYQAKNRRI